MQQDPIEALRNDRRLFVGVPVILLRADQYAKRFGDALSNQVQWVDQSAATVEAVSAGFVAKVMYNSILTHYAQPLLKGEEELAVTCTMIHQLTKLSDSGSFGAGSYMVGAESLRLIADLSKIASHLVADREGKVAADSPILGTESSERVQDSDGEFYDIVWSTTSQRGTQLHAFISGFSVGDGSLCSREFLGSAVHSETRCGGCVRMVASGRL